MKTIAVALSAVVGLVLGAIWLMDYSERSESHFKTYRELEQSELIGKGWVPPFIPQSAYEIYERHRVDQPHINVRFRFMPGDTDKVKASCALASSDDANTRSYRCKHTGDFVVVRLKDDGTGTIISG
jgi:hypothetical protein